MYRSIFLSLSIIFSCEYSEDKASRLLLIFVLVYRDTPLLAWKDTPSTDRKGHWSNFFNEIFIQTNVTILYKKQPANYLAYGDLRNKI